MIKFIRLPKHLFVLTGLMFCLIELSAQAQTTRTPKPTGEFDIGTMTYEWTDTSRELKISNNNGDKRSVVVQLWYPAELDSNSARAPYSSLSQEYRHVLSYSYLRPAFKTGLSKTNLVLISPGRGTERFLYTTIAEDLASHGFIVASVDMPEIGFTIYRDGLVILPSSKFKTPPGMMAGPYEKVDEFFKEPTQIGAEDLEFSIQKIAQLNEDDIDKRFTGHINLDDIGIFGHSLGGRIAGEVTARNKNVKAYISMEGIPPRDVRYQGKINIPIAMLCSSGTLPYAIENYQSLIDNRSNSVYMIELIDFGHNSVTDNPYIYPENFNYKINAAKALEISRKIVTSYFKKFLFKSESFVERIEELENLKITNYK